MCRLANEVNLDVDPGGLSEDIGSIIASKLQLDNGASLTSPSVCKGSGDISFIPEITVIDIYNYLLTLSQYEYAALRYYYKMEGDCERVMSE